MFYKVLLPFESLTKYFLDGTSSMHCSKKEHSLKLKLLDKSIVKTFLEFLFLCNKRIYTKIEACLREQQTSPLIHTQQHL